MNAESNSVNIFERHLTLWVGLCILAGICLGRLAPDLARVCQGTLDWFRSEAAHVS